MSSDYELLRQLNIDIGKAEAQGDREFSRNSLPRRSRCVERTASASTIETASYQGSPRARNDPPRWLRSRFST
jgi:hypothetical protein